MYNLELPYGTYQQQIVMSRLHEEITSQRDISTKAMLSVRTS